MPSSLVAPRSAAFAMLSSASFGIKAHFPVSSRAHVWSQLEHVAGIPSDGARGVPLSKLKILDTIIGQLLAMRASGAQALQSLGSKTQEEDAGQLIATLQGQAQARAKSLEDAFYAPFLPKEGLLFSIQA